MSQPDDILIVTDSQWLIWVNSRIPTFLDDGAGHPAGGISSRRT